MPLAAAYLIAVGMGFGSGCGFGSGSGSGSGLGVRRELAVHVDHAPSVLVVLGEAGGVDRSALAVAAFICCVCCCMCDCRLRWPGRRV